MAESTTGALALAVRLAPLYPRGMRTGRANAGSVAGAGLHTQAPLGGEPRLMSPRCS